jgi:hypothetical protein
MEEIDAATFAEWMAFDSIEPLDAAGAILKGFAGSSERAESPSAPASPPWMQQKHNMLRWFNLFGKKKE